jgi:hypothetical protein
MAAPIAQRMTAIMDGDFAVFLIGMRINRPWKVWRWAPVAAAMPRMLVELGRRPELGLLHARTFFGFPNIVVTQYWKSFDHLHRYAADPGLAHLPAWKAFNKAVGSNGDVGIWHETYVIAAGRHESVYNNMPPFGLGRAGRLEPATGGRKDARARLKAGGGERAS